MNKELVLSSVYNIESFSCIKEISYFLMINIDKYVNVIGFRSIKCIQNLPVRLKNVKFIIRNLSP